MQTFGIDKNYEEINFEQVSVEELQMISGGSGGLSLTEGGFAILAMAAIPGINVGLVAFSLALGVTLIVGGAFA
jgi:predicted regulator of Ras-like GTPase activity (Roadblock/LC7/MglB family)